MVGTCLLLRLLLLLVDSSAKAITFAFRRRRNETMCLLIGLID